MQLFFDGCVMFKEYMCSFITKNIKQILTIWREPNCWAVTDGARAAIPDQDKCRLIMICKVRYLVMMYFIIFSIGMTCSVKFERLISPF
jgi:hypothetical protein